MKGILIILFSLIYHKSYCQQQEVNYSEVLTADSVVIFFNKDFHLTGKSCAWGKRYTRIDKYGDFFETFIDSSKQNILGIGNYQAGRKHGLFYLYHTNGNLFANGSYQNGYPVGSWKFFYENGKQERILFIKGGEIKLLEYYNKEGVRIVTDGYGYFDGKPDIHPEITWVDRINIVNGFPDGEWRAQSEKGPIREIFNNGKFKSGTGPFIFKSLGSTNYTSSRLNNFFPDNYLRKLEALKLLDCSETATVKWEEFMPPYSFPEKPAEFYYNLNIAIDNLIKGDSANVDYYYPGENRIILKLYVNNKNQGYGFDKLTIWGEKFYNLLIDHLKIYAPFHPGKSNHNYLHLVITRNNNKLTHRLYPSEEPSMIR